MIRAECQICASEYTASCPMLECESCEGSYCRDCLKNYLNTSPFHMTPDGPEPVCMFPGCEAAISLQFQWKSLPIGWRNKDLKKLRNNFTMQRERDLLSHKDVQEEAAFRKPVVLNKPLITELRDKMKDIRIRKGKLTERRKNCKAQLAAGWHPTGSSTRRLLGAQLKCYANDYRSLNLKNDSHRRHIFYLENGGDESQFTSDRSYWDQLSDQLRDQGRGDANLLPVRTTPSSSVTALSTAKPKFVSRCPVTGCKGIIGEKNECILCKVPCCPKCHETCVEGHKCSQDVLDNLERIRKSCKPCPNPSCGTAIEKSYGCSQMWCPSCKTFFDWNSLQIITTGPRHNPEYIRWVRQTGGVQRPDAECGRMTYAALYRAFGCKDTPTLRYTFWENILQLALHTQGIQNRKRAQIAPYESRNRDLAIRYLSDDIDEKRWKSLIMKRNKAADTLAEQCSSLGFLSLALQHVVTNSAISWITNQDESADALMMKQVMGAINEFNKQSAFISVCQQVKSFYVDPDAGFGTDGYIGAHRVLETRKWKKSELLA